MTVTLDWLAGCVQCSDAADAGDGDDSAAGSTITPAAACYLS